MRFRKAVHFRLTRKQLAFLEKTAANKSRKFGKPVTTAAIIRAMINREMDDQALKEKVWDET